MRVLLIDIDSTIPNLALKKCEKYHADRGDEVVWNNELMRYSADKIYVSCVFTKNRSKCEEWEGSALIGGSGYDLAVKLPKEIEEVKPRINWGFTTRGCVRNCHFCFVPKMEGNIQVVGDVYDLWDRKAKEIFLMDNNILAAPEHFKRICEQIKKNGLKVDFNQGLDLRILYENRDLVHSLKEIRHFALRFAWDQPDAKMQERLIWAYEIFGQSTVYVIAGFEPFSNVLEKLNVIKKIGHRAYLQRHESIYSEPQYIQLARWVNQRHMFAKKTFSQFCEC